MLNSDSNWLNSLRLEWGAGQGGAGMRRGRTYNYNITQHGLEWNAMLPLVAVLLLHSYSELELNI